MENTRRKTKKYVLLAILLVAVFVLPSCRTRISNNSEITNVKYDEDGFMSESYQERRDELGLSTAERPIMPNLGSNETDDDDDFSEGESIDYNPEEFQEDFPEPETNTNNNNNNNSNSNNNGTRTPTRQTTPPTRRSTSGTTTTRYTVTFKGNGGKPETQTRTFTRNSKLDFPTKPTRSGYTFDGWYTSKSGGSKVDSKVKVTSSTTLYAHWKENATPKPPKEDTTTYEVSVDLKGGEMIGEIKSSYKKDETFNLPGAEKTGYTLKEWIVNGTSKKVGSQITVTEPLKIEAKWEIEPVDYWNAAIADRGESCTYYADENGELIQDCNGSSEDENPEYAIGFVKMNASETDVKNAANKLKDIGGEVLILSNPPKRDSKSELVYKYYLFKELYGVDLGISKVEKETDVDGKELFKRFTVPSDEGGEG